MAEGVTARSRTLTALFFVLLLLVMFLSIKKFFNFYDEGLILVSAVRVSQGQIPYKDFWGIYPPAQFYVIGGLFKIFGESILMVRVYDTLVRFLIAIGVFLAMRKLVSPGFALLAAGLAGLMVGTIGFYAYPVFPALALAIWAVWAWLSHTASGKRRWLLASGVLLGVDTLVRWDIALYATLSLLLSEYLFLYFCRSSEARAGPLSEPKRNISLRRIFAPLKTLAWFFGPLLGIAVIGYGFLGIRSGWDNLWADVFYFPTFLLRAGRWLAYPPLLGSDFPPTPDWWRFYLPFLVLGVVGVAGIVALIKRRVQPDAYFFGVVAMLLFAALLFNQALSRYDYIHVLPASLLTLMVCVAFAFRALRSLSQRGLRAAVYLLLALTAFIYFRQTVDDLQETLGASPPWGCYSRLARADCLPLSPDQANAVTYIDAVTGPNEPIFVGNTRHDKVFVNDVGFYYLSGRPAATQYQELQPGSADTLAVQKTIESEIEAKQVKWIVLVDIGDSHEPNRSNVSGGVTSLDDYLRSEYRGAASFGIYHVLERWP